MRRLRELMRNTATLSLTLGLLLPLAAGCAGVHLPRTITDGNVASEREKRNAEFTQQFEKQRDFAEYEAANASWVQQNNPKACREALEKLLARRPQHREARLLMVELLLADDDAPTAYKHAKVALDSYPNDAEVHYTMALVYDAQGKTDEALGYYERAATMAPQNAAYAAAYRTAREAAREETRHSKCKVLKAPESRDDLAGEVVPVGYAAPLAPLPPTGGRADSRGTSKHADFAGVAAGGSAADWTQQGQAALAKGSPQAALECFRQAAATEPDNPQIPISAAAALLRAAQPEMAVELLTPAAKRFPTSAAIHRMLGAAYYRLGDYKSSQVALRQSLSLDKSSALSYLLMGYTLAKLGQNESAEAHFQQARTLDPRYKVVR